jgi:PAS domain S-box-containing protein
VIKFIILINRFSNNLSLKIFMKNNSKSETRDFRPHTEEEVKTILRTAIDGFYLVDMEGRILETNDSYCSMIGYSREELLKMSVKDIEALETQEVIQKRINKILKTGSDRFETSHKCKDGKIIVIEASVNYLIEEQPRLFCFMRDITDRKRAEEALLESEVRYRMLYDTFSDGILIADVETKTFKYANPAMCFMLGYSEDELRLMGLQDIHPKKDSLRIIAEFEKLAKGVGSHSSEIPCVRKDGTIFYADISNANIFFDGRPHSMGIFRDISERNRAEEKVRQLAAIVRSSEDAIIGKNLDGIVTSWNKGAENIYGYSESEIVGNSISLLIPQENGDELNQIMDKIKSGENIKHFETVRLRKDGRPIQMSLTVSPIFNAEGRIVAASVIEHDITVRKKSELELIRAKDQAESANKLKDAFIANISHEIRTPLNGILGMTSLIKEMYQNNIKKEDEEIFQGIDFSSKRIIRTIDMILNYSRLHIGEFNIIPNKIILSDICSNLVKEFNASANYKSLELSFQNKCGNAVIFADEYSVTMAVSNLIDNAIKFTSSGSVSLSLYKGNADDIILDIKDTGVGIDKDYLNNIFEPYRQEQMGYGRAYEGIGLGLAIVKKVINLNNAVINVESKKGEGTTFSINFGSFANLNNISVEPGKTMNVPPPLEKQGIVTILLVEDDQLNQMTIKRFIEKSYSCIITDSSDSVIEILKRGKVDLILMDISIRGSKNGLELTNEIKTATEFSHLPVIAITAHAFEEDKQNALSSGCDDFLPKPFSKQKLLDTISLYLNKSR